MDFKKLFEETGYKAKENRFLKAPPTPYIVFYDDQFHRGADYTISKIVDHNLDVKLYVENIEEKSILEKLEDIIDSLNVDYSKTTEWIDEESHFEVTYTFLFVEKKKGGR